MSERTWTCTDCGARAPGAALPRDWAQGWGDGPAWCLWCRAPAAARRAYEVATAAAARWKRYAKQQRLVLARRFDARLAELKHDAVRRQLEGERDRLRAALEAIEAVALDADRDHAATQAWLLACRALRKGDADAAREGAR